MWSSCNVSIRPDAINIFWEGHSVSLSDDSSVTICPKDQSQHAVYHVCSAWKAQRQTSLIKNANNQKTAHSWPAKTVSTPTIYHISANCAVTVRSASSVLTSYCYVWLYCPRIHTVIQSNYPPHNVLNASQRVKLNIPVPHTHTHNACAFPLLLTIHLRYLLPKISCFQTPL